MIFSWTTEARAAKNSNIYGAALLVIIIKVKQDEHMHVPADPNIQSKYLTPRADAAGANN